MSQDRNKSLAAPCYSKVNKLLQLDGEDSPSAHVCGLAGRDGHCEVQCARRLDVRNVLDSADSAVSLSRSRFGAGCGLVQQVEFDAMPLDVRASFERIVKAVRAFKRRHGANRARTATG